MSLSGKLLAWVEPRASDRYLVSLVGGAAPGREPATRLCGSLNEARQWVETEAAALGVPIEWLPGDRRRTPRAQA